MTERPVVTSSTLLIIACLVIVVAGLKAAQSVLVPFLLAIFIATIATTPIRWLNEHRVPVWLSVTLVLIFLVLVLMGLGLVVVQTLQEFQAEQAFYEERVRVLATDAIRSLRDFGFEIADEDLLKIADPSQIINLAGQALRSIGEILSNAFLIFLTVVFILAEGAALPQKLKRVLSERKMEIDWLTRFARTLNRYIAIKTTTSVATGILVTSLLMILGVDFAILWGLLAFMLNYIPNIGSAIAATPAILVALVQLGPGYALIALLGYVVINVGIGAGVEPRFLGRSLGLSTLVVFLSLIFWGWMFGAIGMLLSVPLTMTAKIALETSESTAWLAHLLEAGESSPPSSKETE